jgi:uncharacterized protein (DUF1697 family)
MSALWFAFLRGINLGKRQVKMAELRDCLAAAGFTAIKTVVASGNVRLEGAGDAAAIKARLEKAIADQFGFEVGVVLPFGALDPEADVARHVLMFDTPLPVGIALADRPGHTEIVRIDAREIYIAGYRQPDGRYTEGVEEVLKPLYAQLGKGVLDTMRNWNTMEKMLA